MTDNSWLTQIPPAARRRFLDATRERDRLQKENEALRARLANEEMVKQEKVAELQDAYGDLCDYIDLMESPRWNDLLADPPIAERSGYLVPRNPNEREVLREHWDLTQKIEQGRLSHYPHKEAT